MFGFNIFEKLFKSIQKGSRVAIFGTGDVALTLKKELQKRRKDTELVCFFDSFKTGELEGTPILSPFEQGDLSEMVDVVIISSFANAKEMELILNNFGIREVVFAPKEIVHPASKRDRAKDKEFKKNTKESLKYLKEKEDRKIYKLLTDIRLGQEEKREKLKEHIDKQGHKVFDTYFPGQYFDFIDKEAIRTVIDGGSHNGVHSAMFVSEFKNIQSVWAFEPLYEKFKHKLYDKIIQNSSKINMTQKALWNEKTTLQFKEIETTTIDAVKKENKIEKVDFIKLDIENSELQALEGAEKTILKDRPQLAVCIYHSNEQFCELPKYLGELLKEQDYVLRLGHYSSDIDETVLYAIPKELYKRRK